LQKESVTTHGAWGNPIFKIWSAMMRRCTNPKDKKYHRYGGRGIKVCERWSNVNNFISKFLDENGLIKDAVGYHRALTAAMNPDKLARHFYEQGKSDALLDSARNIKNIDMEVRNSPAPITNSGFQVKSLNDDAGRGLRIKSRK
jgi:hypothetical protein